LFAAGWSGYFISALGVVAKQDEGELADAAVDAEIDLLQLGDLLPSSERGCC